MIVRLEYGSRDRCVEIDLMDSVAARKWLFVLNENLKNLNAWKSFPNRLAKYVTLPHAPHSAHSKNVAYQKILAGIKGCEENIEGAKFPFTPKLDMNWTETQQIHRAFTTSMTTLKTFDHGLDVSQLMKLKFCDVKERHQLMKKWTKKEFTIKDIDKFIYYSHMINDGIHDYEPHLESERSFELKEEGFYGMQIFNQWAKKPPNLQSIFLTPSEIETSFKHFHECDVYIHSNIFGKAYLETYLENDPPLEADVSNVEIITGEFSYFVGDRDMRKKFFTDSPFTRWAEDIKTWAPGTPIPTHFILPVPIGRIVGSDCKFLGPGKDTTEEEWQANWRDFVLDKPTSVRVKWQQHYEPITVGDPKQDWKDSLL